MRVKAPGFGGIEIDSGDLEQSGDGKKIRLEMKLDALASGADDQEEEGEERPDDGDPGRRDFLEGENGDKDGAGPGVHGGKKARDVRIARAAEIGADIEKRGHERERDEAKSEVLPLLGGVYVD